MKEQSNLFVKYIFLTLFLNVVFVFLGFKTMSYVMRWYHSKQVEMREDDQKPPLDFPLDSNSLEGMEGRRPPRDKNMSFVVGAVILFTFLSSLIAIGTLLLYFRQKAAIAKSVMTDLKSGHLKSRFPVEKIDETGLIMLEFNNMADEIERLVTKVKKSEESRKQLLQDLSHDLKTPLASLRLIIENLQNSIHEMTEVQSKHFLNASHHEVIYVSELVEDLLFLSKVDEAGFNIQPQRVDLRGLLNSEISQCKTLEQSKGIAFTFCDEATSSRAIVNGDVTLLKRMIRNILVNAASFAKTKVDVFLKKTDVGKLEITVIDDGKGFPNEMILAYGSRTTSRKFLDTTGGRVSTGLGSVITSKIVTLHGGSLMASNYLAQNGEVRGAQIKIII